jgi:hypothetical protein
MGRHFKTSKAVLLTIAIDDRCTGRVLLAKCREGALKVV